MSRERTTPTRPWRGTSADDRRAERRERFIEAALEVIGTNGAANATVRAVCKRAGLTDRYFYETFGSQEALLLEVFELVRDEVVAAVLDAFANAPPDPRSKAHASITAAFTLLTDDPRKGRVLLLEAVTDERLAQRRQEALLANAELLAGIAEQYFGEHPGDPTDTKLTALAIVGAETELAAAYLAGNLDVTRERLIDHLTELTSLWRSSAPRPRKPAVSNTHPRARYPRKAGALSDHGSNTAARREQGSEGGRSELGAER